MDELHKTFFSIVNTGIIPQLEYILSKKGLDVNKVDENGRTALHLTAMNEHYEACLMLAKHKSTEITSDAKRESVLHVLARKKMLEVDTKMIKTLIQALIKRGGDVNQENKAGNTPLHDAISHGNRIMTKLLLSNGAKPLIPNHNGETAVHCCFINFGEEIADIMVKKFSSVIDKLRPRGTERSEQSLVLLLHWVVHLSVDKEQNEKTLNTKERILLEAIFTNCIKKGHSDMVAVLLHEPININTTDFNGWTPLHYATMQGQFKIAKQILQQHVDILVDRDGNTALYYLMQKIPQPRETCLYWQVLSLFVRQGLDINFPNEKGETPLHEAAFRSNLPALQYLVSGADLTLQTNTGETALHYAARCNSIDVLKLLLAHASEEQLNIIGVDGTPEEVAIKCFNREAKLEFKSRRNRTLLQVLPRSIWLKAFEFLSADTLARVSQVCTTFLNLSRDDSLWKVLVASRGEGTLLRTLHHMHCFDSPTASEFVKSVLIRDNNLRAHYFDRTLLLKCTAYVEPEDIPSATVSKYDTMRKSMSAMFNKILKKSTTDITPPKNNSEETPPQSPRVRPLVHHPCKVLVMGAPSTVKSTLTRRLSVSMSLTTNCTDHWKQQETLFASVLSDWSIVILPVGETSQEIKIKEVDDKQFLNLCKECDGVVLHCDYSHAACIDTLAASLREVKQKCSKDVRVVVFGAADDRNSRVVTFEEITSLCQSAFEDGVGLQAYFEDPALNAELALHLLMTSMRRVQKQAMKM